MKRQIRRGVFETNSSSMHSLTICSQVEYDAWEKGELLMDSYDDVFVKPADVEADSDRYQTVKEYFNNDLESFDKKFTSPSGDKMVAFGYYGYDG